MCKGVSVVVCCYNSASRLPKTIEHLAKQVTNNIPYEVIVVDNNCSDTTIVVAQEEWSKFSTNANFKIVHEKTSGLSAARHKGVEEASYEYIIFCDDDNWLEENYIAIAYEILSANPNVGLVGGQSEAITDKVGGFPDWFEMYKECFAVGQQAGKTGVVTNRGFLWGAALAFKKEVFVACYKHLPSILSDRKGKELSSGGDSEFCLRGILLGYDLFYDERLFFKHFISCDRLTVAYLDSLIHGFTKASSILKAYNRISEFNLWSRKKKIILTVKCLIKLVFSKIIFRLNDLNKEYYCQFLFIATGLVWDDKVVDKNLQSLRLISKKLQENRIARA